MKNLGNWRNVNTLLKERNFGELLDAQFDLGHFVCMGLDPVYDRIPLSVIGRFEGNDVELIEEAIAYYNFCVSIVDATHDLVAAYKPNTAFFEAAGHYGYELLRLLIRHIMRVAPDVVVLVDAKRADIGKTNVGPARFIFDILRADGVTVNPYFGGEALEPFLARAGKGVVILCRTSNDGAKEFQSLTVGLTMEQMRSAHLDPEWERVPLYQAIALGVGGWKSEATKAVVLGATAPDEVGEVRSILPDILALLPGVGVQGGKLGPAVQRGKNQFGRGFLINAGSSELYASSGPDFAQATRERIIELNRAIAELLNT